MHAGREGENNNFSYANARLVYTTHKVERKETTEWGEMMAEREKRKRPAVELPQKPPVIFFSLQCHMGDNF